MQHNLQSSKNVFDKLSAAVSGAMWTVLAYYDSGGNNLLLTQRFMPDIYNVINAFRNEKLPWMRLSK
jgi:hypothetical protein